MSQHGCLSGSAIMWHRHISLPHAFGCAGRADPDVEVLRARDYKVGPDNVRDDNDFSPGLAQRAPANLVSPPSTPARRKGRPGCEPRRINRDVGTSWHMDALTECLSGQNRQLLFQRSCLFRTELKNRDNSRRIERQLEWQTEELFHGRASIGPSSAKIRLLGDLSVPQEACVSMRTTC